MIKLPRSNAVVLAVYRTGPITAVFYDELSSMLELLVLYSCPIVITGDLNIHLDDPDDVNTIKLCTLLDSFVWAHLGETDRVRSDDDDDDDDDDVGDDLVGMIFSVSCFVFLFCRSCACCYRCYILWSNNYSIDPILSSVLFETTSFSHPRICQSILIMKHHPPTRCYSPLQFNISKNVVFIPELPIFTDFCRLFVRKNVKYEPIWRWFSLSDSLQQALQHCRSKSVASQTSLHENNYRNFFKGESVSVR